MKVRCVNNSIRLRLLRSELSTLKTGAALTTRLDFTSSLSLTWELAIGSSNQFEVDYRNHLVSLKIPPQVARLWIESDQVGIETTLKNDTVELHLLIEKDFPCKDRLDEDKSETFEDLAKRGETC